MYLSAGSAMMGDVITAEAGMRIAFKLATQPIAGSKLRLLVDGVAVEHLPSPKTEDAGVSCVYPWQSDGKPHWVRAELDDANGEPLTLTNPIYVNWPQQR